MSSICGVITSFMAISRLSGGFSFSFIPAFVFPVLAWIFQIMPVSPLVMIETSLAIFVTFGAGGLLGLQLYMISRGQTYHELQKNINIYGRTMTENFADVMGRNWWFCWILPFISSPYPGDGTHYPPKDQVGTKWNTGRPQDKASGKRKTIKST
jgi:palmitoyltransferase